MRAPRQAVLGLLPVLWLSGSPLTGQSETPDVGAFLDSYCVRCHGASKPKGGVVLEGIELHGLDLQGIDLRGTGFHGIGEASADLQMRITQQLQTGLMPPRGKKQPAPSERAAVVHALEAALRESPHAAAWRARMLLPQYGNWVDHEALFDGSIDEPPFTFARLWRDSSYVFARDRRVSRKVKGVQSPFTATTPENGIRDYAAAAQVDASVVETQTLNARAELDWLIAQAQAQVEAQARDPKGRRRPDPLAPFVVNDAAPTEAACEAIVEQTFARVVGRPADAAERARYVDFLQQNLDDTGDALGSVRTALTAIYLSPEALYRIEWGLGPVDAHGRRHLAPAEIASALSHTLFDTTPYQLPRGSAQRLREAWEQGRLTTSEDVARVVRQILDEDGWRPVGGRNAHTQPRLMRFFHEFFGYDRAPTVFKDADRVAAWKLWHDPRRLVADADNLVKAILREDRHVFEQLLTTNRALVFHDGDNAAVRRAHEQRLADLASWDADRVARETERRKQGILKKPRYKNDPDAAAARIAAIERESKNLLAQKQAEYAQVQAAGIAPRSTKPRDRAYTRAYNLDFRDWDWPAEQPFELPPEQRAGLLTHPAWLVAHSVNDGNDPIHRGIWVQEKLLAGRIADVPPDVDARVPEAAHETLRQRMDVVRQRSCWKCHHKINPLGEAFESYDDFGRHRTTIHFDADGREAFAPAEGTTSRPIDASGSFDGLGVPGLTGEFADAVEMLHALAETDRARQSILRHLFRFLLGRNETLSDSRTLRNADRAYLESGGSFRAAVASILSSDSFLYRR